MKTIKKTTKKRTTKPFNLDATIAEAVTQTLKNSCVVDDALDTLMYNSKFRDYLEKKVTAIVNAKAGK
jgi:hypothetical protein